MLGEQSSETCQIAETKTKAKMFMLLATRSLKRDVILMCIACVVFLHENIGVCMSSKQSMIILKKSPSIRTGQDFNFFSRSDFDSVCVPVTGKNSTDFASTPAVLALGF